MVLSHALGCVTDPPRLGLPERLNRVLADRPVVGDDAKALRLGLGDEDAVERVFVQQGQGGERGDMGGADVQNAGPRQFRGLSPPRPRIANGQETLLRLDDDFPVGHDADDVFACLDETARLRRESLGFAKRPQPRTRIEEVSGLSDRPRTLRPLHR